MIKYLLGTNIVSETLRPKPNAQVLARLKKYQDELAIPSIVWHELWYGALWLEPSRKRKSIEEYLNQVLGLTVPILAYDARAAAWHAAERARLARLGKLPPFVDGQIAAIAAVNGLTLVTLNTSDYANFQDFAIKNWSK